MRFPDQVEKKTREEIKKLKGPILVFGAGGFIGINLLQTLLQQRKDVYGISQNPKNNWRFIATQIPLAHLLGCDITEITQVERVIQKIKPQTIFNLAAYGSYSKQEEYKKIYPTNFNSAIDIIEIAKIYGFSAYIYSGSQSEYGLNCAGPKEQTELSPNSHYAVSKTAAYYSLKYYGKIEKLPIIHFRLYSAYGPWEEPDRLIPMIVQKGRHKTYPPLVQPHVSRDFIYISDIVRAFIKSAAHMKPAYYGEAFNIGTGIKTTIKELAFKIKKICQIPSEPTFGRMPNRSWDLTDWYGNIEKAGKDLHWQPQVSLAEGLEKTIQWQEDVGYDTAFWNWTK
jgi:dolichol-phosphate mannosyltransferase